MPRKKQPRKPGPTSEHFYFAAEAWHFHDSLSTNLHHSTRRNFGPVSSYREVKLSGSLISRTKRPIRSADLLVWPRGPEPSEWPDGHDVVGTLLYVRDRKMTIVYDVTETAFLAILTVASVGRIVEFSVTIEDLRHSRGRVRGVRIGTEPSDPEDLA